MDHGHPIPSPRIYGNYGHGSTRWFYGQHILIRDAFASTQATAAHDAYQLPALPKSSCSRHASSHFTRQPAVETAEKLDPVSTNTKATPKDARNAGIPAGYSYKNWDPAEEPIILLGSVFDANSLGKRIYDWTIFYYGPSTPLAEMAGELWLRLLELAGKMKRAEETISKIRQKKSRRMVEDFLKSGECLWARFDGILKVCEGYMWKTVEEESGGKKLISMGDNSGSEFVETIFGRDRQLDVTERLMTGMRLWSMRFDANCEDILRYPSARERC